MTAAAVEPVAPPSTADENEPVRVFGIRHHGPGSARSLLAALGEYQPDAVLIEGPADADPLVSWVTAEGMQPPLALLAYARDEPKIASCRQMASLAPSGAWLCSTFNIFCSASAAPSFVAAASVTSRSNRRTWARSCPKS